MPNRINHYQVKEEPAGLGIFKAFFCEPARALVTLAVPSYGLAILGLAAIGDRANARSQRGRQASLFWFSDVPVFTRPYTRNEA